MYVYDQAHTLAKAVRESEEYKLLRRCRQNVESEPQAKKMIEDYQKKHYEIQKLKLIGQEVPDETAQAFRQMHEIIWANSSVREYLEAENRFALMMADIQRIVVEGLDIEG